MDGICDLQYSTPNTLSFVSGMVQQQQQQEQQQEVTNSSSLNGGIDLEQLHQHAVLDSHVLKLRKDKLKKNFFLAVL